MKKFIACLTLACLASMALTQAGEGKSSKKAASPDKAKVTTSAKTGCSENAACGSSAQTACTEKSSSCENEKLARKVAKPPEKGATFLVKR